MGRRIGRSALAMIVLAACVTLGTAVGVPPADAAPYPPIPPVDDTCVLYYASIGSNCTLGTPTVMKVQAGEKFTISRSVGSAMYGTAVSCGDLACVYKSAYFLLHGPGVSVDGVCTNYGGFESPGTYTRELTGTPGRCQLRYDPPAYFLESPGGWARVNFFTGQGSFPATGETVLVGVRPELFKVDVTATDPSRGRTPAGVYLVAAGKNPDPSTCPTTVTGTWLPDRKRPSCMKLLLSWTEAYSAYVPDGTWDIIGVEGTGGGEGGIRDRATGWATKRITVDGADLAKQIIRKPTPDLLVSAVVSTGRQVGMNKDSILSIQVRADGPQDSIPLENVTARVFQTSKGGSLSFPAGSVATPATPGAVRLAAGQEALFRMPMRGAQVGDVDLRVYASGATKFSDSESGEVTLPIEVTPEPPPPPPPPTPDAEACGRDMLTKVSVASTGALLQLLSVKGIDPGDNLIIRPCTPQAEQVTVTGVVGKTLSVEPSLARVHPAGSEVVRAPEDATILNKAVPAGTTTLPVAGTSFLRKGDEIVIEPGTNRAETGKVAGFGSILLRAPTKERHPAGAVVRRVTGRR